ncbi:MAG TPA: hypothetical protein VK502_00045, partial [Candidatus Saccharimonadales bacterium]|nr:hypothetical protein [Candidatus Saccharimonadales bacterium]
MVTLLLGVVCITSPAKADGLPQFSASATSGSAGSLVSVTQVDPCPDQLPSPAPGQYVEFTFTDAAGVKTRSHSSLTVDTGDWIGSPNLYIPSKHISNIDTSRTWADAATGVGSFTVRCFSGSQTTRAYQPKPFIVTGPSPGFRLSSAKIQLEETIQISSADACPLSMPYGHVAIASSEAGVSADMVFDSASGGWHANIKIPKVVTDAMGTSRSFSLGRAVVSASCFNQDGHAVNYGHTLLEVVAA